MSLSADEQGVGICPVGGRWRPWIGSSWQSVCDLNCTMAKLNHGCAEKAVHRNPVQKIHKHRESCWIQEVCVCSNVGFVCAVPGWSPAQECSVLLAEPSYIPQKYRILCDDIRADVSLMAVIRCFWGICQIGIICKIAILISKSCLRE